ncbi:uncharacterized protein LOC118442072 [Vespa mandarinia]|uniref:uncharacterized protein LOC118442072 n=1 Tax=Vespa mandarinia TaxID=7446 RepID=UPI001621CA27|nr:uncharacterized protein LOC118442072 [Vespa mandarinia]
MSRAILSVEILVLFIALNIHSKPFILLIHHMYFFIAQIFKKCSIDRLGKIRRINNFPTGEIKNTFMELFTYFMVIARTSRYKNRRIIGTFKMFRSKEFQRSVMPLIIVNSIVCTGLLEYFVDRTIRIIGFAYVCIKLFIEQIESCRQGMDVLNVPENYSSFLWYQCVIYGFLIFIILALTLAEFFWFSETMLWRSSMFLLFYIDFYPVIIMLITDFTFVFWISMLRTTIDSPQHARVLRMKDNWEDDLSLSTVYGTYKTNENFVKLKRIKQIHLELMKCARIINEAYGLPILISIFTSILDFLFLHYDFESFLNVRDVRRYILTFVISFICRKHWRDSIRDFMMQLIQNRLKFTACGFYDLDHTFMYSAIGSITTYLVILIQVGGEPEVYINNTIYNSTSMT